MIQQAIETGDLSQLSVILTTVRETGALEASRLAAASEATASHRGTELPQA